MLDLEREADEAELAFIESVRGIHSAEDEEYMKQMLYEYLNILKLIRLKRSTIGKMMSLRPFQNALEQPHTRIVGV